ncbi:MAG TPA: ATP-dependent Clp protease ATP-binding subunit, partial [bacterium]|nr:ATP-dependent Clp protease ATP-binding subunit [bacterium]
MKKIKQIENRTLLGYHDKNVNKFGLLDNDKLPILINEDYSLFLLTRDHNYSISTKSIQILLNNYEIDKKFRKSKRGLSFLIIVPGLIISVIYLIKFFFLSAGFSPLIDTLLTKSVNLSFWIAVIGISLLWHDYARYQSTSVKIPDAEIIPDKELKSIKTQGFKFARYIQLELKHFISLDTLEFLTESISGKTFNTMQMFRILINDPEIEKIIRRCNIDLSSEKLEQNDISESTLPEYPIEGLRSILTYALEDALLSNSSEIEPEHIFVTFFKVFPVLKTYLVKSGNSIEIIREIVRFHEDRKKKVQNTKITNPDVPYYPVGGIGKYWIYGHTFILNKFSKDITERMSKVQDKYGIGHDREIEEIISIVGRMSNKNVLLVGEAGVGKSSIIKGLAQRIVRGKINPQLLGKKIIQLDITSLLAQGVGKGNLEELIQKALNELSFSGNTILYIDEIQEIIPAKSDQSGSSLASIMLPYILESEFPIIGTINYADYKKFFYSNESLRQSFDNVEVSPLSPIETLHILETQIEKLEENFNLYIT